MKNLPTKYLQGQTDGVPGPINVDFAAPAPDVASPIRQGLGALQSVARDERIAQERRERKEAALREHTATQRRANQELDLAGQKGTITEQMRNLQLEIKDSNKPPHTWYGEITAFRDKLLDQAGLLYPDAPGVQEQYINHVNAEFEQYGGLVIRDADIALTSGALYHMDDMKDRFVRQIELNFFDPKEALDTFTRQLDSYDSLLRSERNNLLEEAEQAFELGEASRHLRVAQSLTTNPQQAEAAFERARRVASRMTDREMAIREVANIDRLEERHMRGTIPSVAEGNINAAAAIGLEFANSRPTRPVAGNSDQPENRLDLKEQAAKVIELIATQERLRTYAGAFNFDVKSDLVDAMLNNMGRSVNEANNLGTEDMTADKVDPLRQNLLQMRDFLAMLPQSEEINAFLPKLQTALSTLESSQTDSDVRTNKVVDELLSQPTARKEEPQARAPKQSKELRGMDNSERQAVFNQIVQRTGELGETTATFILSGVTTLPYAESQFVDDFQAGNVDRFQDMIHSLDASGANLSAGSSVHQSIVGLGRSMNYPTIANALLFAHNEGDAATVALMSDNAFVLDMSRAGALLDGKIALEEKMISQRGVMFDGDPEVKASVDIKRGGITTTVNFDPMHQTVLLPSKVVSPDGKTTGSFRSLYETEAGGADTNDPSMAHFRASSFAARAPYFKARYAFHYANRLKTSGGEFGELSIHRYAMKEATRDASAGLIGVPAISDEKGNVLEAFGYFFHNDASIRRDGFFGRRLFGKYDGTFQFMPLLDGLGTADGDLSPNGRLIVEQANNLTDGTVFGGGQKISLNGTSITLSDIEDDIGRSLIEKCRPCFDQIGLFRQEDGSRAYLLPYESIDSSEDLFDVIFYESNGGLKVRFKTEEEKLNPELMPRVPKNRTDLNTGAALPHLQWNPNFGARSLQEADPNAEMLGQFVHVARQQLGQGATQPEVVALVDALVKEHGWPSVRTM